MPPTLQQTIADDRPLIEPLARLVRAYDRAIRACEAFDHAAARAAIGVLRSALELDSSTARSFDALYAWCEESVDNRDYVGAAQCLRTLRNAWRAAINPSTDVPTSPGSPADRWSETPSVTRSVTRSVIVPRTDIPVS